MSASPLATHDSKRLASARSRIALGGLQMRSVTPGGWWVWKSSWARFCPGLADLELVAAEVARGRK